MGTRWKALQLLRLLPALAAALLFAPRTFALSPDLQIRQLYHTAWTAAEGAPTGVEFMAQTSDGYLWIAAAAGLFRFDGIRFERIDSVRGRRLPSSNVLTLHAPRTGGLWIGYRFGGATFIKGSAVTNYAAQEGLGDGSVTQFAQDRAGIVWASTARGLKRFDGVYWHDARETYNLPSEYVKSVHVARDETVWIVVGREVMSMRPEQPVFMPTGIGTSEAENEFIEASDGTLWLTDASLGVRAVRNRDGEVQVASGWTAIHDERREPLWGKLLDRDGTLWAASASGIHRLKDLGRLLGERLAAAASRDAFSDVDGLTAQYASAFLEDREGNVWVGTTGGLHRFRHSRLTRVDFPRAANGFAIAAGEGGAILVGIDSGDGVFEVRGPSAVDLVPGPRSITCAYRDDDGVVWLGGRGMVWHFGGAGGKSQWTPIAVPIDRANADYYPVQAIAKDRAGGLWVSVVRGGVFRLVDGQWTRFGEPALSLAAGRRGQVWIGYPKSRIHVVDVVTNEVREYSVAEGLDLGNIMSMLPRVRDGWVGGELGLARFDGQRFHAVTQRGGRQLPSVSGIVTTRQGDLWLSSSEGGIKIDAADVQHLAADPDHRINYSLFDFLDGMPGTPTSIRPLPTIAAGTDGRLWFATSNGVVWLDPQATRHNPLAPDVEVQSIVADGVRYLPRPGLQLPIGTRNLQVSYTALSLSIPERVRFRYQLGAEEPWQDAGARRAAYFTNLDPGDYSFRVTAANDDGVWNEIGTSIDFTIPPAFHQTRWFYALCALAFLGALTVLYRVRVHQVAAQVRGRLEARLAERERIARDLHDTLLQGMQGLIWRFQAVTDRIPPGEPARQLMEQSLDRADKLLGESRDKVKDLRPSGNEAADLAKALAAEGEQFAQLHDTQFKASVEGAPRDLHPIVREEGFLIGREALSNAFSHAQARNIEVEISYGDAALHVRIRDDGRGITPGVLDAGGAPGHFGLLGMRERAKKLGAHIEVWSKPGVGTEVDLRVPADVAYKRSPAAARGLRSWLSPAMR
jgi:signal transduction histidine kinase/ligand-binding sensor domain-containing protein